MVIVRCLQLEKYAVFIFCKVWNIDHTDPYRPALKKKTCMRKHAFWNTLDSYLGPIWGLLLSVMGLIVLLFKTSEKIQKIMATRHFDVSNIILSGRG